MSHYTTWSRRTGDMIMDDGSHQSLGAVSPLGSWPIFVLGGAAAGAGVGALVGGHEHRVRDAVIGSVIGMIAVPVGIAAIILVPWMHK